MPPVETHRGCDFAHQICNSRAVKQKVLRKCHQVWHVCKHHYYILIVAFSIF